LIDEGCINKNATDFGKKFRFLWHFLF